MASQSTPKKAGGPKTRLRGIAAQMGMMLAFTALWHWISGPVESSIERLTHHAAFSGSWLACPVAVLAALLHNAAHDGAHHALHSAAHAFLSRLRRLSRSIPRVS
jgi:hypothetical protein